MAWIWEKDVSAVKVGLYGHYGADFDAGVDRLTEMITRRNKTPYVEFNKPTAVAYSDVAQCAKTLVALSSNAAFSAGVIAMTSALLPKHYLDAFPDDVETLRAKFVHQRTPHY